MRLVVDLVLGAEPDIRGRPLDRALLQAGDRRADVRGVGVPGGSTQYGIAGQLDEPPLWSGSCPSG